MTDTEAIDRTDIRDKHWILFVADSFRRRALPLIWEVLPKRGATSAKEQKKLFKELISLIPQDSQVVLLGDREFRSTSLMRFCTRLGWHFRLRLKNDTQEELFNRTLYLEQLMTTGGGWQDLSARAQAGQWWCCRWSKAYSDGTGTVSSAKNFMD